MSKIIKQDTDGNAFAVVTDIAKYCEVAEKSVKNLIRDNINDFIKCSEILEKEIFTILRKNKGKEISKGNTLNETEISVPKLELATYDDGSDIIDWSNVRLYQPHIELLLMLMRNTKQVKEHKINLIADFFATKFELALMKQKEQQRLIKQLQKQVDKLEKDKFIDWSDEWITASMYVAEHKELGLNATELLDALSDANLINTEIKTRQVRSPNGNESIYGKKGVLLIKKKEIDKLFNI